MSGSEFYTARELAQLLKVSESTIWSYTRKGKLPHYKLGKDYRYRLPEVLAALRGLEERSSSGRCTRAGYSSRARRPDRAFERRGFSEGKIPEGGAARNLHCLGDRLEKVKEYFAAQSSIEGVYLFGSFGTSLETPLSDIDFGLIFAEGEEDKGLWELLEIEGALSLLLEREKVDVVNLNTAPAAVRFAAISEGDLVFARDPGRVEDFREQTIDYYLDYQPVLAKMYRDYEEHLREGSSSAKWGD